MDTGKPIVGSHFSSPGCADGFMGTHTSTKKHSPAQLDFDGADRLRAVFRQPARGWGGVECWRVDRGGGVRAAAGASAADRGGAAEVPRLRALHQHRQCVTSPSLLTRRAPSPGKLRWRRLCPPLSHYSNHQLVLVADMRLCSLPLFSLLDLSPTAKRSP